MSSAVHRSGSAGELSLTISGGPRLLDPVGQVLNQVKEEIPLWNNDDFFGLFEAFAGSEVEPLSHVLTEALELTKFA